MTDGSLSLRALWITIARELALRHKALKGLARYVSVDARVEIDAVWRLRRSGLFDRDWYQRQFPPGTSPGREPLRHYLRQGAAAGHDPNPLFDTDWYLAQNPAVAASGINPLLHYVRSGTPQGRDPNPLFDTDWYLAQNPEVGAAGTNPLAHYLREGARAGRDPSLFFDSDWYLTRNPDVAAAGCNPLAHYLHVGAAQGRQPLPEEDYPLADAWYDATSPEVSIIVLNYNKAHFTELCLRYLWRHTRDHRYEILVVDNGSRPEDFARLARFSGRYRLLRLRENRQFGEGNNIGAEAALASYLCFLNNDALVGTDWLASLMRVFDEEADCGAVGPKFVYPDGRLQEAGALINAEGGSVQLGKGGDPHDPRFNQRRRVDYVSAAALLLRRVTFEAVLGFDLQWEPAYYEDCDLCLKIGAVGQAVYYCPQSTVVHFENATTADAEHGLKAVPRMVATNRTKFMARWGEYLRGDRSSPHVSPFVPATSAPPVPALVPSFPSKRQRLALFTAAPVADNASTRRFFALASAFASSFSAWLVTPERYSRLRLATLAERYGCDPDRLRSLPIDQITAAEPFDVAIVEGRQLVPPCPALARVNVFLSSGTECPPAERLAARWSFWDRYQGIVVVSEEEREALARALAATALPALPIAVIADPPDFSLPLPTRFVEKWRRIMAPSEESSLNTYRWGST